MDKIIDKDFFKLSYNQDNRCIYEKWIGYVSSQQWKDIHIEMLEIFQKYDIAKALVDASKQSVVKKADSDWTAKNILPKYVERGLRYAAIILPHDQFAKMAIDNFKEIVNDKLIIKYFNSTDEAEEWLFLCKL